MNVHWVESALADLRAIEAHISQHSPQYARGMVTRLFTQSEQLALHPLSGAIVPEYGKEDLREVFERPYRIIYCIRGDQVDVVAVVHAARELP